MRFKRRGIRWMRIVHIVSTGIWFGATVAVLALGIQAFFSATASEFVAIASTIMALLWVALASMAVFSLLQAVAYGLWTQWGFFKHRWVTWKWVVVAAMLPLIAASLLVLPHSTDKARAGTFTGGLADGGVFLALVTAQVVGLLVAIWLSVFKPGKAPAPARAPREARPARAEAPPKPASDLAPAKPAAPPAPTAAQMADLQAQLDDARSAQADLQARLDQTMAARESAMDQIAAGMAELATSTGPISPVVLAASTASLTPAALEPAALAPAALAPAAPARSAPVSTARAAATPAPAPESAPRPIWLDPADQPLCNDCGTCYQELPALFERTTILVDGAAQVVARLKPGALDTLEITDDLARRIARVKDTCDSELIR